MLEQDLTIRRGAVFHAHAWPLADNAGNPLRSVDGLTVSAQIRAWRGAETVLHHFAAAAVLLTVSGQYGDAPVAVAQIHAMTVAQTTALTFASGVYDVLVDGEPVVGGLVRAPWVVTREAVS